MSRYQEALHRIQHEVAYPSEDCYVDLVKSYESLNIAYQTIQELVDKETELQSRKDKLVIGSEWVCVVEHMSSQKVSIYVGDDVFIRLLDNGYVGYGDGFYKYGDNETHFLLCFKPKEETK